MAQRVSGRINVDTEVASAELFFLYGDTGAECKISFARQTVTLSGVGSLRLASGGMSPDEPRAFRWGRTWDILSTVNFGDTETDMIRLSQRPLTIEKTPGVCGGAARIQGTRIPVWTLERYKQLGSTNRELLTYYPSLTQAVLRAAQDYARRHQDEIAAAILRNEARAAS